MSLFGQYVTELKGKQIIETSKGFVTYSFTEDAIYIEDIFVTKKERNSNLGSSLADEVALIGRENGKKRMLGSVIPTAHGSTTSLKVLLSYGFRLDSATNNFILFSKDIL